MPLRDYLPFMYFLEFSE